MPSPSVWQAFNDSTVKSHKAPAYKAPPISKVPHTNPIPSTSSPGSASSQDGSLSSSSPSASSSSRPPPRSGTSSLNSSPPCKGVQCNVVALSHFTTPALSPRTQDTLEARCESLQRQPSHHKPLPPPPHLHRSFSDWQNSLQSQAHQGAYPSQSYPSARHSYSNPSDAFTVTAPTFPTSMHTATADSTSHVAPDLSTTPPYAHNQKREEDEAMRSPERVRGKKSRRASSGGSRIPGDVGREYLETSSIIDGSIIDGSIIDGSIIDGSIIDGEIGPAVAGGYSGTLEHAQPVREGNFTASAPSSSRWPNADRSPATSGNVASPTEAASSSSSLPGSSFTGAPLTRNRPPPHLDLANYSPQELLKILAALLHQIATSNDHLRPMNGQEDRDRRRHARKAGQSDEARPGNPSKLTASGTPALEQSRRAVTTAAMGALGTPSSTLCFHARNIPSISIESYLLRILKYCPTTNDVFLSLLIYFDRMSRMGAGAAPGSRSDSPAGAAAGLPRAEGEGRQRDARDMSRGGSRDGQEGGERPTTEEDAHPGMRGFVIDSYNVHRLVIAGITVASKFFSDIFYTNSRYAKVGGLPVHELNQLELQFLLLNDFHLVIPLEELQRYADQLLVYGAEGGTLGASRVKNVGNSSVGGGTAGSTEEKTRRKKGEGIGYTTGERSRSAAGEGAMEFVSPAPDRSTPAPPSIS